MDGKKGQIVALGGGGFSMEPDNPLLDEFILSLVPKRKAKICFIPTASAETAYRKAIAEGLIGGYAADDGAALHFRGDDLIEVVSSRPNAAAYRVEIVEGTVRETRIEARYLGL